MSTKVFLVIIFAAFLHAIWNAMVKKEDNKYLSLTAIVLGHTPIAVAILFLFPWPSIQSVPYIFISAIFLTGYEWVIFIFRKMAPLINPIVVLVSPNLQILSILVVGFIPTLLYSTIVIRMIIVLVFPIQLTL